MTLPPSGASAPASQPVGSADDVSPIPADAELVAATHAGDADAFAELWRRHAAAAHVAARHFTSIAEADDLVAEAYTRILASIRRGGGPTGPFRPYLYSTVRNLARQLSAREPDVALSDIDLFGEPEPDPADRALDRTLTVAAFRSLPERWRTVLWYTEVEGLDPHEVAPFLGTTANGAAAIAYRAREGLRRAWLQAHVQDENTPFECRWTARRLGRYERSGLSAPDTARLEEHLLGCARCTAIAAEVHDVGSRLALVLAPLILGVGAGTLLATLHATPATAAPLAATAAAVGPGAPAGAAAPAATPTSAATALPHLVRAAARLSRPVRWIIAAAGTAIVGSAAVTTVLIATSVGPVTPAVEAGPAITAAPSPIASAPATGTPSPTPSATPSLAPETPRTPAIAPPRPTSAAPRPSASQEPAPATPTVPAAPQVTSTIDPTAATRPALTGTALPRAVIVVTDGAGAPLATVTADAAGAWSTGVLDALAPTASALRITQRDSTGTVSPPTVLGPLAFVPTILTAGDPLLCPVGGTVPVQLAAWSGTSLSVVLDDDDPVIVASGADPAFTVRCGDIVGDHVVSVRYEGASAAVTMNVAVTAG